VVAWLAINPQTVNVSSGYSTSLCLLAALVACQRLAEALEQCGVGPRALARAGAVLALPACTLLALKLTAALLVLGSVAAAIALLRPWSGPERRRCALALGGGALIASAVLLVPWLVGHRAAWVAAPAAVPAPALPAPPRWPELAASYGGLLSSGAHGYGGTPLHTLALVAVVAVTGALAAATAWRETAGPRRAAGAAVASAAAGVVVSYVLLPALTNPTGALRYVSPQLIAAVPAGLLFLARHAPPARGRIRRVGAALLLLLVLALSASELLRRLRVVGSHRTALAYPMATDPYHGLYSAWALGPDARGRVRNLQALVPPGERLWTWTELCFHLDYARNPVCDASQLSALGRWADGLVGSPPETLRRALRAMGVRWVLWQHRGYASWSREALSHYARLPSPSDRRVFLTWLAILDGLELIARQDRLVADDGELALFELR
jgi:hypothetical protein